MQGEFPIREGILMGFDNPVDQGILLAWGLWEAPEADNDDEFDPPPTAA